MRSAAAGGAEEARAQKHEHGEDITSLVYVRPRAARRSARPWRVAGDAEVLRKKEAGTERREFTAASFSGRSSARGTHAASKHAQHTSSTRSSGTPPAHECSGGHDKLGGTRVVDHVRHLGECSDGGAVAGTGRRADLQRQRRASRVAAITRPESSSKLQQHPSRSSDRRARLCATSCEHDGGWRVAAYCVVRVFTCACQNARSTFERLGAKLAGCAGRDGEECPSTACPQCDQAKARRKQTRGGVGVRGGASFERSGRTKEGFTGALTPPAGGRRGGGSGSAAGVGSSEPRLARACSVPACAHAEQSDSGGRERSPALRRPHRGSEARCVRGQMRRGASGRRLGPSQVRRRRRRRVTEGSCARD